MFPAYKSAMNLFSGRKLKKSDKVQNPSWNMQLGTWSVWPNFECIDQVSAILTFVTSFFERIKISSNF